jgi:hypothetical protein
MKLLVDHLFCPFLGLQIFIIDTVSTQIFVCGPFPGLEYIHCKLRFFKVTSFKKDILKV